MHQKLVCTSLTHQCLPLYQSIYTAYQCTRLFLFHTTLTRHPCLLRRQLSHVQWIQKGLHHVPTSHKPLSHTIMLYCFRPFFSTVSWYSKDFYCDIRVNGVTFSTRTSWSWQLLSTDNLNKALRSALTGLAN